jgi:acyl dehydratase
VSTPTSFLNEAMRRQAIGRKGPAVTVEVEKGAIQAFSRAIGDDNPLFNDEAAARRGRYGGLVAPPTFLRSVGSVRPELPFELPFTRLLDGGSDWEYFEPVRPGDRITSASQITDIAERTGRAGLMLFMTIVITYRNQFDHLVATQTSTTIRY